MTQMSEQTQTENKTSEGNSESKWEKLGRYDSLPEDIKSKLQKKHYGKGEGESIDGYYYKTVYNEEFKDYSVIRIKSRFGNKPYVKSKRYSLKHIETGPAEAINAIIETDKRKDGYWEFANSHNIKGNLGTENIICVAIFKEEMKD